ncbi:hypothetical protein P3X46_028049 [Hevea brasiliensis]|uniref:NAB domain-containing protein n=1 Tax=Hevea brasiliensis TaxID=3981 RepID=A0ABQ9KMS9_HEVBR|nr:kinase-interacting family protein [Hevea brasiliensis]KAJ9145696.1 hypothetical protein P3X46_028049 [Hevea brasiliensis]
MSIYISSFQPTINSFSLLLPNVMADLHHRIKTFLETEQAAAAAGDSFSERAEWFFRRRPQLLALLQDLYNGYISLVDRCNKMQGNKHQRRCSSSLTSADTSFDEKEEEDVDHDVGKILYQYQTQGAVQSSEAKFGVDEIVAHMVMKSVEEDILEQECQESWRKVELLKKLLEVLESERIYLLNENASLGCKMAALIEENKGLSSEALFLKRKAAQLARCVLKMREDHRVWMLTRKIEDLQGQIYGLEKRNNEYYQQLLKKENLENEKVGLMGCFQLKRLKFKKRNEAAVSVNSGGGGACGGSKRVHNWWWWERVKKGIASPSFSSSTT